MNEFACNGSPTTQTTSFWEKANTASTSAPFASSNQSAFSGVEVTPLSFGKQGGGDTIQTPCEAGQISGNGGSGFEDANKNGGCLGVPEASVFQLFSSPTGPTPKTGTNQESTTPTPGIAQITPKLNA